MSASNRTGWIGRDDGEEGAGPWRWHQAMRNWDAAESGAVALVGFACDAGVLRNHGRVGAAEGPAALRAALANLPLHAPISLRDAGDISAAAGEGGDALENMQSRYADLARNILASGSRPIGLGGGHEIALASWNGLMAAQPDVARTRRVGIVNFDAHFDLRAGTQATSGTPFRQIADQCAESGQPFHYMCLGISRYANTRALFERATTLGVHWLSDEQLGLTQLATAATQLQKYLDTLDDIYLTFCLDVLPASVAPGVSAPAARGVSLEVIEPLLDQVLGTGRVRIADIAELNPRFDIDQRTARVAARIVARIAGAER